MSTIADPNKAYAWQDGDAFRAPEGTALPVAPFSNTPTTGTGPGVIWDGFGGVEAGFEKNPKQDTKKHPVFNKRKRPYKITRGMREESIKFRAVDYSKAAVLTSLLGGSIAQVGATDVYQWIEGDSENFAFLWTLGDESDGGDDRIGFYVAEATLATPPPRSFTGENLDGWELEIEALSEVIPISNFNPLAP